MLEELPSIDRTDIASFLIKVGTVFASHAGGTSGPMWGTAFLKAGLKAKGKTELTMGDLVQMGRAAVQGIMARGGAQVGDKTLKNSAKAEKTILNPRFKLLPKPPPPLSKEPGIGPRNGGVNRMPATARSARLIPELSRWQ